MANTTLQLKKSGVTGNVPDSLSHGELAINYADGKLFYRHANNSIASIDSGGSSSDSFSTINVASSLILASSPFDTLSIVPGNNVSISANTISKTITINSTLAANASDQAVNDTQNTRMSIIEGVNSGQNTTINALIQNDNVFNDLIYLELKPVNNDQNTAITIIQGVNAGQNTRMSIIEGVDTGQNTRMSIIEGVDAGQNTRMSIIEGVNTDQNTRITITEGVDVGQNTRLTNIESVNLDQNNAITIIQGVDVTQNTRITSVDTFASGAYDKANSANVLAQNAYDVANTKFSSSGGLISGSVTISGNNDLIVTGNLSVLGNTFSVNTQTLEVVDPIISLALGNYFSDALDIGLSGHYNDGTNAHTGLIRDHGTKDWYLFQGYTPDLSGNNNIDISHPSFNTANLIANKIIAQNVIVNGVDFSQSQTTQNNRITAVDTYANGAFAKANTNSDSIAIIQGINTTQNTRLDIADINFAEIDAVDTTQNTNITAAYVHANNAFNQANTNSGLIDDVQNLQFTQNGRLTALENVNTTQNTRITLIEGVNANQNTRIAIVEGVNTGQNTRMSIIEGVDTTQNTNITIATNAGQSAFAQANSANVLAQNAYDAANTKFNSSGGNISGSVTITGNNSLTVTGNLTVLGSTTSINTEVYEVVDPMIKLAIGNYFSDALDIGFAGHYNDGSNAHTGLIRDHGTKDYYLFQGYTPELAGNNNININDVSFETANLNAKFIKGNVISSTVVADGRELGTYTQSAFNQANASNNLASSSYNQANAANNLASSAYDQANAASNLASSASSNTIVIQGVNDTQNTRMSIIEGVDTDQNTRMTIIEGVDTTQNTNITIATNAGQGAFDQANNTAGGLTSANARLTIIEGVDTTQNTNITIATNAAQSAFAQANNTAGGLTSANTRLTIIEGVDTDQNTRMTIIEGVNSGQNTRMSIIEGIDVTQNTNITIATNAGQGAFDQANNTAGGLTSANARLTIIEGVDLDQNTRITAADAKAQAAFNAANTGGGGGSGADQYARDTANLAIGIDVTQNTRLTIIEGVNTDQNTRITISEGVNTDQNTRITISEGVNTDQNTRITAAFDRANLSITTSGGTISGSLNVTQNLSVTGNLSVLGTTTSINTQQYEVVDPMIKLAIGNYTSDLVDIGFAGHYNDGANAHTGLFRDFATKDYYLFQGYTPELSGNNNVDINHASFSTANLRASLLRSNVIATTISTSTISIDGRDQSSVDSSQNTVINFILGVDTAQNTRMSIIEGVDTAQNTRITINEGVDTGQNTRMTIIEGVDTTQNTNITHALNASAGAFLQANTAAGGLTSANTRLTIIEGVDVGQNTRMTIIEGVNTGQNTRMTIIEGVDVGQNTRMTIIEGVDLGQNTRITAAFDRANTALTPAGNTTTSVQIGSLGVGTAASGTTGEIRATNNITAFFTSDFRFKENIQNIPNALDIVDNIKGKTFDWTDSYISNHGGEDGYFIRKSDFGVIAQDVLKVFPLAVREKEDGSLAVDYSKLVALAFAAISELRKEIDEIKKSK
jgi:hypothetical protein